MTTEKKIIKSGVGVKLKFRERRESLLLDSAYTQAKQKCWTKSTYIATNDCDVLISVDLQQRQDHSMVSLTISHLDRKVQLKRTRIAIVIAI